MSEYAPARSGEQFDVLRTALVNDPEHIRLYQTSAVFKAEIDTLCLLLPSWIDGIATRAGKLDARMAEVVEKLTREPSVMHFNVGSGPVPSAPPWWAQDPTR